MSLIIHLGLSAHSFIGLGQRGFSGRERESPAEEKANPRAEGKESNSMPIEALLILLMINLG